MIMVSFCCEDASGFWAMVFMVSWLRLRVRCAGSVIVGFGTGGGDLRVWSKGIVPLPGRAIHAVTTTARWLG
jgi:hypothetical protein